MADVDALKKKFAGYPNILIHLDFLAAAGEESREALERFDVMKIDPVKKTVSLDEGPRSEISLLRLDEFLRAVELSRKYVGI